MLPEVAVIVTAYVPDGVPGVVWVDGEPLPPHPTENANASTITGAARTGGRLRFRISDHPEASSVSGQIRGIGPVGKLTGGTNPVVTGAVIRTARGMRRDKVEFTTQLLDVS